MSAESPQRGNDLTESGLTIPSDSENYEANNELSSSSPPSSSNSPLILYSPPTVWGLLRGAAINLLLPFINGLMLGFGELFANEMAFRLGWSNTKVWILSCGSTAYTGSPLPTCSPPPSRWMHYASHVVSSANLPTPIRSSQHTEPALVSKFDKTT
jgi:hypothetical protein